MLRIGRWKRYCCLSGFDIILDLRLIRLMFTYKRWLSSCNRAWPVLSFHLTQRWYALTGLRNRWYEATKFGINKDKMATIAAIQRSVVKSIVLLSLSGFFLTIIAVSFHYNDKFLLRSRCIYQTRTAISGVMSKVKVDSAPVVIVASLGLAAVFLLSAPFVHINTTIFSFSHTDYIFPNKAPPVRS